MINLPTNTLDAAIISGVVFEGLSVTTRDGRPARLAVVDEDNNIIEAGPAVAREAFNVSVEITHNFWKDKGHLRVLSGPPGLFNPAKAA
jgi:hypothetical protein